MGTDRTFEDKTRNYDDDLGDDGDNGDSGGGCNIEQRKPTYPYHGRGPDIIIQDTCGKITDFVVWCLFSDNIPELQNVKFQILLVEICRCRT
jgi:hypothetical protein